MTSTLQIQETVSLPFTLDPTQQKAVSLCCDISQRVVGVTGAAGSGKTTILQTAYRALEANGYSIALAAPTGKAAKRIYEVTGIEAFTNHRLLEYTHPGDPDPKTGRVSQFSYPRRTRANPLEIDVLFVDEYAMVNNDLHRSLFDALRPGASIRVFGDNNQLPPIEEDKRLVGSLSPFMQLLHKFSSVELETVHRQGKDSGILLNLQSILKGRMPTRNDQWTMHFSERPVDDLRDYVLDAMEERSVDFTSFSNQIITPQNTSWVGTVKLNVMMQSLFHNKLEPALFVPRHNWVKGEGDVKGGFIRMFVGDKVIVTRNMYDLNVFNGESGKIIEITHDGEIIIDFGDREQAIPPVLMVQNRYGKIVEIDPRRDIDLGYVITTHKSQGSEYDNVVYVLNKSTGWMQNRRNFYTATSRGREHVHIITDQRSISFSLTKLG